MFRNKKLFTLLITLLLTLFSCNTETPGEKALREKQELFFTAANKNDVETIRQMIETGESVYIKNKQGKTLLEVAKENNATEAVEMLSVFGDSPNFSQGDYPNVLFYAIYNDLPSPTIEMLIHEGVDLETRVYGFTALMKAIDTKCDIQIIQTLIDAGADVNTWADTGVDIENMTPLMMAVANNNYEATKALINAGADINVEWSQARLPVLFLAVIVDAAESLQVLIDAGADVNKPYVLHGNRAMPLAYAEMLGKSKASSVLQRAGARLF